MDLKSFFRRIQGEFKKKSIFRYFNNIFWLFADKGVKLVTELLVGLYVARYLGAEYFGLLSFAISYVTITYGISSLGLSGLLTREIVKFKSRQNVILGTAFGLRILAAILFIVVLNVSTYLFSLEYAVRLIIFIISWSILWKSFDIIESYFQAEVASEKIARIRIISTLVTSMLKIVFILSNQSLHSFAYAYTIEWTISAIGLYILYSRNKSLFVWRFEFRMGLLLLRNSWYLILSGLAIDLYMRIDQLMIRQLIGDSANGHYAVATRISEIWYAIPMITCGVFFPALLNSKNVSNELFNKRVLHLFSLMFWTALMIAVVIAPFSESLIVFLYSEEYRAAGKVLGIHIWTGIFVFFGVSTTYWSLSQNLQYISLLRTICGLFVNITLNFMLIPIYGINGAAISSLISQAMASSFSLLLFRKTREAFFVQLSSIVLPFKLLYEK